MGWTKKDNKMLRNMIKEGKSTDEIIKTMGYNKLRNNPNKKYVSKFNKFISEMIFTPKESIYNLNQSKSNIFENELDYVSRFKTDSNEEYVIDFIYLKDTIGKFKDRNIFNLSFTTEINRNLGDHNLYEKETNKNEIIELSKRLLYVIQESINIIKIKYPNFVILIGETENPQKIKFYRNLIKDSLDLKEIESESSYTNGLRAFYYE